MNDEHLVKQKLKKSIVKLVLIFSTLFFCIGIYAQGSFAPAAGEPGSTAIHRDSSAIVAWASSCTVERGYINITDPTETCTQSGITSNYAFFGHDTLAIGYPETNMTCVSLGDGGSAIVEFEYPIINGDGYDFAVFENGFQDVFPPLLYFLELGFVEVSSDGEHFVRFPSVSETSTETQIGSFENLDPTNIYNLAGKYVADYGTPFDLDDLVDSLGLDLNNITHVKIIDVVGIIDSEYSSYDSEGNIINDPWATPFESGGFDFNAVGVINSSGNQSVGESNSFSSVNIWPNPVRSGENLNLQIQNSYKESDFQIKIIDIQGNIVLSRALNNNENITLAEDMNSGLYVLYVIASEGKFYTQKFVVK